MAQGAKNYYRWSNQDLLLEVQVQTKASKTAIIGEHNNRLKITITAPPADGKANEHIIKFLAKYFGVPSHKVTIVKGHLNKYKSITISDPKNNLDFFKK